MPISAVRLLILGDSSVGKTSLASRFTGDSFDPKPCHTVGVDFRVKSREYNGKRINVQIWDSAGQERFNSVVPSFYRSAHAVMFVYDVTKVHSFANISSRLDEFQMQEEYDVPKILVGNKTDLLPQRAITKCTGKVFADEHNMEFIECSAKANENVDNAFVCIIEQVLENVPCEAIDSNGCRCSDLHLHMFNLARSASDRFTMDTNLIKQCRPSRKPKWFCPVLPKKRAILRTSSTKSSFASLFCCCFAQYN